MKQVLILVLIFASAPAFAAPVETSLSPGNAQKALAGFLYHSPGMKLTGDAEDGETVIGMVANALTANPKSTNVNTCTVSGAAGSQMMDCSLDMDFGLGDIEIDYRAKVNFDGKVLNVEKFDDEVIVNKSA